MHNFKENRLELFLYTAVERHKIFLKRREGKSRPWTEDIVLHKYRFCNVYRELDKCSSWMIDNIIHKAKSLNELWPAVIAYRYISSYNIYEQLKENCNDLFDMEEVHRELKKLRQDGIKFNGCFLRNPKVKGGWAPIHEVPFMLIKEIQEDGHLPSVVATQSFEKLTKYFTGFSATSGFMGHQYCCDLEYSSWFDPTDKYTYATMGPGSRQGMNLLLGIDRRAPMKQSVWLKNARKLRSLMLKRFIKELEIYDVSMQDVQNWLCEFQKYVKYLGMEKGKVRVKARKYEGVENA